MLSGLFVFYFTKRVNLDHQPTSSACKLIDPSIDCKVIDLVHVCEVHGSQWSWSFCGFSCLRGPRDLLSSLSLIVAEISWWSLWSFFWFFGFLVFWSECASAYVRVRLSWCGPVQLTERWNLSNLKKSFVACKRKCEIVYIDFVVCTLALALAPKP